MLKRKYKKYTQSRFTSDDQAMLNERKYDQRNKKKESVCDTHIDGA